MMEVQVGGRRRAKARDRNRGRASDRDRSPSADGSSPSKQRQMHGQRQGRRAGTGRGRGEGQGKRKGKGKSQGRRDANRMAGKQERTVDIHQLASADMGTVMAIARTCRLFKVDASNWDCSAPKEEGVAVHTLLPNVAVAGPCDAHFDPQTGSRCGKRARCFQTMLQEGADETIKQQMDGVATKTFVRQNLEDPRRFVTFLNTFNHAAENVLTQLCLNKGLVYGKDVVFAFKGGNVMRLVLLDVMAKLPSAFRAEWDELMQIGDMDFEVFIDDATDQMVRDATVLMLYVIYAFRVYLQQGGWVMRVDDVCKEGMKQVVHGVTDLKTEGHQAHSQDSITIPYMLRDGCDLLYVPLQSVLMQTANVGSKNGGWLRTAARPDTPLSVSMNRSLSFGIIQKKGVAPEADIVLLRLKHGMMVIVDAMCSRRAAAEVIDVSIPTNRDRMHRIKSDDKRVEWFTRYEFNLGGEVLRIFAPSLDNFVLDLHMFMFVLSEYPWFDPKREKRMKRYVWFCTMLRAQLGANPASIAAELTSVARALAALIKKASASTVTEPESSRRATTPSSLAHRVSPWAELVSSIEATRHKALAASLGQADWLVFVADMRRTIITVRRSYELLGDLPETEGAVRARVRGLSESSPALMLARATLAMAAVSVSHALTAATVPPPLS